MVKGFIDYEGKQISFVIYEYRLELFACGPELSEFIKQYNFKENYILKGKCYTDGFVCRNITMLVEKNLAARCWLKCYYIEQVGKNEKNFDSINFQSKYLDSIFRYKYNYMEMSRSGINLAIDQKEVYNIDFEIDGKSHTLTYKIGQKQNMGVLEDFSIWGESSVNIQSGDIEQYYKVSLLIERMMKFVINSSDVGFEKITLTNNGILEGLFYCNFLSTKQDGDCGVLFYEFDVMKYIPRILNNLAKEVGEKISECVPVGYIQNYDTLFSPARFIDQVISFEYMYRKLEPQKANKRNITLQMQLKEMLDVYTAILHITNMSTEEIARNIKTVRVDITRGYAYYYDFRGNTALHYQILKLDDLIKCMSLSWMGFDLAEIEAYKTW